MADWIRPSKSNQLLGVCVCVYECVGRITSIAGPSQNSPEQQPRLPIDDKVTCVMQTFNPHTDTHAPAKHPSGVCTTGVYTKCMKIGGHFGARYCNAGPLFAPRFLLFIFLLR
jgi:hypothetical protein